MLRIHLGETSHHGWLMHKQRQGGSNLEIHRATSSVCPQQARQPPVFHLLDGGNQQGCPVVSTVPRSTTAPRPANQDAPRGRATPGAGRSQLRPGTPPAPRGAPGRPRRASPEPHARPSGHGLEAPQGNSSKLSEKLVDRNLTGVVIKLAEYGM